MVFLRCARRRARIIITATTAALSPSMLSVYTMRDASYPAYAHAHYMSLRQQQYRSPRASYVIFIAARALYSSFIHIILAGSAHATLSMLSYIIVIFIVYCCVNTSIIFHGMRVIYLRIIAHASSITIAHYGYSITIECGRSSYTKHHNIALALPCIILIDHHPGVRRRSPLSLYSTIHCRGVVGDHGITAIGVVYALYIIAVIDVTLKHAVSRGGSRYGARR